ncbi:hypothetical protein [Arcobacter arenosus]|uniref:hypothetical protein n=1 Tax=Arcobacter arenosus TaxID=2576037 RepID=UPI003BAB3AE1
MTKEDFEYIYETCFSQFHKKEFDTVSCEDKPILYKDEVISVLEYFSENLEKIKNLKIDMGDTHSEKYERKKKQLELKLNELQAFSTSPINIDLFPKSIYFYYSLAKNYLSNRYNINEDAIFAGLNYIYYSHFKIERKRKTKKPKIAKEEQKQEQEFLKDFLVKADEKNQKWNIHCDNNSKLTLEELLKTFENNS